MGPQEHFFSRFAERGTPRKVNGAEWCEERALRAIRIFHTPDTFLTQIGQIVRLCVNFDRLECYLEAHSSSWVGKPFVLAFPSSSRVRKPPGYSKTTFPTEY